MRTKLSAELTFRELLRRVRETAVEAYTNQDFPFERLVELLQVPARCQPFAALSNQFCRPRLSRGGTAPPGKSDRAAFHHHAHLQIRFHPHVGAVPGGWTMVTEHNTDLFDAGRVERLLEHWRVILESVAANPDKRLSAIPMLTAAEQRMILHEWNHTERNYPQNQCVHELFEAQARRTPDAVAVQFEGNHLTYGELDPAPGRWRRICGRSASRCAGGSLRGALPGNDCGPAGHPQSRRRLCAAGPPNTRKSGLTSSCKTPGHQSL